MRKEMLQKEHMWFPGELSNKLGEQNTKDKNVDWRAHEQGDT